MGPLSRLHGLSVDNIVEVELVTHDGMLVYASEKENKGMHFQVHIVQEIELDFQICSGV